MQHDASMGYIVRRAIGVSSVSMYCLWNSPLSIIVRPERKTVSKVHAKRPADQKRGTDFDEEADLYVLYHTNSCRSRIASLWGRRHIYTEYFDVSLCQRFFCATVVYIDSVYAPIVTNSNT
jgi:hypothetical protein